MECDILHIGKAVTALFLPMVLICGASAMDIGGRPAGYFSGTLDEISIYNSSMTPEEIYMQYVSELKKLNASDWLFYSNISGLSGGVYTYYGCGKSASGEDFCTDGGGLRYLFADVSSYITDISATGSGSLPYVFGSSANLAYIDITLSCNDPQCDKTFYCVDSDNSCSPGTLYASAIRISAQGTSYIRYYSNTTGGLDEPVRYGRIVMARQSDSSGSATSGGPSSSGGGFFLPDHKFGIEDIKVVMTETSAEVEAVVKNTGDVDEQNITLYIEECPERWDCGSALISELGFGREASARIPVAVPETAEPQKYTLSLVAKNQHHSCKGSFDMLSRPECFSDRDCKNDEHCVGYLCVKLFDAKIIRADSPVKPGEHFDFTYLMKGMGEIEGDVIVKFSLEKDGEVITSGSDTIYLGSHEEKTETTGIFLPGDSPTGVYDFYVRVNYGNYMAEAHRTIEVEHYTSLVLDMQVDGIREIIAGGVYNFSATLSSNKDSPVRVYLEEAISGSEGIVWSREKTVEISKTLKIEENVGVLDIGDYRLNITAGYDGNKTITSSQNFSVRTVSESAKEYMIIIAVVLSVLAFCLILYGKRKKISSGIRKEEKKIGSEIRKDEKKLKKHKLLAAIMLLIAAFAFASYAGLVPDGLYTSVGSSIFAVLGVLESVFLSRIKYLFYWLTALSFLTAFLIFRRWKARHPREIEEIKQVESAFGEKSRPFLKNILPPALIVAILCLFLFGVVEIPKIIPETLSSALDYIFSSVSAIFATTIRPALPFAAALLLSALLVWKLWLGKFVWRRRMRRKILSGK